MLSGPLARASEQVSDRFAGVCNQRVEKPVLAAGSRQVRCVSDVLARGTLKNDQTYEPVRHFFDTVIYLFCVMTLCVRRKDAPIV